MPKNWMICRPASALMAMTRKALKALTRMVRCRCSRLRCCVKWMKKGTTPIGLTIASSAISGLYRSIGRLWRPAGAGFQGAAASVRA